MPEDFSEVMTMREAARYLGYSYAWFKANIADGIPSIQHVPNGKRFFRRKDLNAWRVLNERPSSVRRGGRAKRQPA